MPTDIDRTTLLTYLRRAPFGGRLSSSQIDGLDAILAYWQQMGLTDERWLAYMLATAFHETGGKMQPVSENLTYSSAARIRQVWLKQFPTEASAAPYVKNPVKLANRVYGGRMGNIKPGDGWLYRGRGLVQITGRDNYAKYGIENSPDAALEPERSVKILFDGMLNGKFTGKRLVGYFNKTEENPEGARAIINGTDKAKLIAGYYRNFLDSLRAATKAEETGITPVDVAPVDAKPDDIKPAESKSFWSLFMTFITGGGVAVFSAINNPFALAALLVVAGVGGLVFLLFLTGKLEIKR